MHINTVWGQITSCYLLVILYDIAEISTTWDGFLNPSQWELLMANNTLFFDVLDKNVEIVQKQSSYKIIHSQKFNKLLIPCSLSKCGGTIEWGTILIKSLCLNKEGHLRIVNGVPLCVGP